MDLCDASTRCEADVEGFELSAGASDARIEALYRRYGPLLFARCRRLLRDEALAEDATQEVFVRICQHLSSAPNDGEVLAWMYRICSNYCLSLLRKRAVRGEEHEPGEELCEEARLADARIEDLDLIHKLMASVPEKLREPALLYHRDGLDQADVARTIGVSRRTVITRLQQFAERAQRFQAREAEQLEQRVARA